MFFPVEQFLGFDNNKTTSTDISSKRQRSRRALNVKNNKQLFQQQRYVEMVLVNDLKLVSII